MNGSIEFDNQAAVGEGEVGEVARDASLMFVTAGEEGFGVEKGHELAFGWRRSSD